MSLSLTHTCNFISFYESEDEWMQQGMSISLEIKFIVKRASSPGRHILQLVFPNHSCQTDLSFDSMMKRNQWYQALTSTSCMYRNYYELEDTFRTVDVTCIHNLIEMLVYHHVDLVRCHEFPSMEGQYVVEVRHLSYKVWPVKEDQLGWKWKFSDIKWCNWNPHAQKLRVVCQRYTIVLYNIMYNMSTFLCII